MFDDESIKFKVVSNHQEQYSIWPTFKEIPAGWIAVGPEGSKEECLDYIEKVWTDMRPKTLRDKMRQGEANPSTELKEAVEKVILQHGTEVEAYGQGKPELYGWFFGRVAEAFPERDPAEIREALDAILPPHNVPESYA